ncbi:hypothetical protein E4T38_01699 [Aureobasidium subglaciale]|nr:hypothetical protein E4T38_01699 [Aureobasidium subglaciale]KAI5222534.1 hypothetical protein E4T40_04916 [Aureobasidium subglaciale]KAI5233124.1 hypothetical protein E4T41_01697 [Aureobasidium subglaciale]KAI5262185.1 hypothetical protein E4T46_04628 [Aureobasidium subglaciale]
MASAIAMLAAMLYASAAFAHPQSVTDKSLAPGNLPVTWYQAPLAFSESLSTDTTCGWAVSTGQLNTTRCYVWNTVSDCSGDGGWTMHAIPSGRSMSCVETGVLDGGNFQHKSAMLTCV